jgi:hypothetical protein
LELEQAISFELQHACGLLPHIERHYQPTVHAIFADKTCHEFGILLKVDREIRNVIELSRRAVGSSQH